MDLYSIKMRASKCGSHTSGAERITSTKEVASSVASLTVRALQHGLGQADFINLKVEKIGPEEIAYLDALPVSTEAAATPAASFKLIAEKLCELGLSEQAEEILTLLRTSAPMRGAMLYDTATKQRIEPDKKRGIRATYMDAEQNFPAATKIHFREALVLATKVVNAPGMLAELCISDDPDYVTGYLASKKHGYVRFSPLKKKGDRRGGRIFIFDSRKASSVDAIHYLEKQKVLVRNLPLAPKTQIPEELYGKELDILKANHLFRSVRTIESEQSKYIQLNGRRILLLSSNSYLDLATDPRVKTAAAETAFKWGTGAGGSRLTTGNTLLHETLERELATFKSTESAILFNTGYMANVGIISALCDRNSVIFSDSLNHASIIDGCRLSGAKIVVYRHNDMADLEMKLNGYPCCRGLIVSDAVFSMDGDIINLPKFVALGKKYNVLTMIDEAHATGVIGKTGHGTVEHFGGICRPDILMGTLSKALGVEGGYACASTTLIDYLRNKARSFIFATSQSPPVLGAALKSLQILEEEPDLPAKLQQNVAFFLRCLNEAGVRAYSPTAIIPIMIGEDAKAMQIAEALLQEGCLIPAIRYPTVAPGSARLRVALMASHSSSDLAFAAKLIAKTLKKYP